MLTNKNKYEGFETVRCLGEDYVFKADFRFLANLKALASIDPMQIQAQLLNADNDPEIVLKIMQAAYQGTNAQEICEQLITRAGFEDCVILCRHLLLYAMVGSEKKQFLHRREMTQKIIKSFLKDSPLKILKNHALLWVYLLLIFGVFQCISFKLSELLT